MCPNARREASYAMRDHDGSHEPVELQLAQSLT